VANNVQAFREALMMSKAELARKAGLSTLTIDRVEAGRPCRLDTQRKILLALGLKVTDKDRVFGALRAAGEPGRSAHQGSRSAADGERTSHEPSTVPANVPDGV
jgi:DNA-binding XRE family transcriptional regulator